MPVDPNQPEDAATLADLPLDELRVYASRLGLRFPPDATAGELLRRIRERQELLLTMDRDALLEICIWGRRPVRHSASKPALAAEIAAIKKMRFEELSDRALQALCILREIPIGSGSPRADMIRALQRAEPWRDYVHRKLRRGIGSMIGRVLAPPEETPPDQVYHYLPEAKSASFKESFEDEGIVGGLTRRIRGAADDYVREKLDEIEARIDRKLDEIDRRLGEWRDREIRNRLTILKWTLIFSIIVALVSLGYDALVSSIRRPGETSVPASPPIRQEHVRNTE